MKRTTTYLLMGGLALVGAITSYASFEGSDDFDDNSKHLDRWDTDQGYGTPPGELTETNGRLEFVSSGPEDTYQGRPWKFSLGSYVSDWAVQLETAIPADSGTGNVVAFGLEIWSTANPNLFVGIDHDNLGGSPQYVSYLGSPSETVSTPGAGTAVTAGAVRISFDAMLKILTTSYDADGPANGYQWTFGASYGISGFGGVTGNSNWGMTDADTFTAVPNGFSSGAPVAAGVVYGDNFFANPEPSSAALLLGGGLLLAGRRNRQARAV